MDLTKLYLIQCIVASTNNMRLTAEKIEIIGLIKEFIKSSRNIEKDLNELKRQTEFSSFAVRLSDIYNFLTKGNVDFNRISEKFRAHSHFITKDLSYTLERLNPASCRQILRSSNGEVIKVNFAAKKERIIISETGDVTREFINVDYNDNENIRQNDALKSKIILEDFESKSDYSFENFEDSILKPIKDIDSFLDKVYSNSYSSVELDRFSKLMIDNSNYSSAVGFELIAKMHRTLARAFMLIKNKNIKPVKEIIESMRACLIVIVAVVKGKDLDIKKFLDRAEEFSKKIQLIN